MVFSKALFLKGLAGVATVGTAALGWGFREQIFGKKEVKEDDLGIPTSCTTTCELTKEQFEKIKFQEKTDSTVTFEGLDANDKVTLTVTDKTSDTTNYPKGKSYKFKTASSEKTIKIKGSGDSDISITNTEVEFKETTGGGKLEKVTVTQNQQSTTDGVNNLGIPNDCESTCELTKDQLEKIKFETQGNSSIAVEGLDANDKVTLKVEDKKDDTTNYPKGKKYTLTSKKETSVTIKNVKDGDISLANNQGVVIRETSTGGKLEKAPGEVDVLGIPKSCTETCEFTSEQLKNLKFEEKTGSTISVTGLSEEEKVTLTITNKPNDTSNYPKGKNYNFKAPTGKTAKITGLKDGDISIDGKGVDFRETTGGGKLETVENSLGIPKSCETSKPCELTKEQLGKIKFESKDGSSTTSIEGLSEGNTVTLTIEDKSTDAVNYPKGKKYNFKTSAAGKTVTIKNAKDQDISISDTGVNFKETGTGGKLEKDNTSS